MNGDEIAGHIVSDGKEESACPPSLTSKPSPKSCPTLIETSHCGDRMGRQLLPSRLGTENDKK